jgi:DNA-binding LytR/AlgR family response regulator
LLLLDIDMPEVSGFDIAREMRQAESDTVLIFISSHEHYVFKSIEYRPFRYIRKQYLEEELYHALKDAYKLIDSESDKTIIIKVDDEDIRLKHSEIMYYEIESRKLSIHLKNKNVLNIRKTIRDFYKELADDNFIQINSGCVVNAKYIDKISSNDITLENGEKLIVSRPRIKNVKSELLEYWGNKI